MYISQSSPDEIPAESSQHRIRLYSVNAVLVVVWKDPLYTK